MKWYFYLTEPSKEFFQTTFHMKLSCGNQDSSWINKRVKEILNEKNDTFQYYLHSNKDHKFFNKFEYV